MAYVYRHIRLDKNEPFYIGISAEEGDKYTRAYTKKERNNLWYKIVAKTDYAVEIILDEISLENAYEKEKEFIKLYGRIDLNIGTMSNLTDGGELFVNLSPETKKRMVEKMSIVRRKPILQYTIDGDFIREWDSAKTAGESLNIPCSHITHCCKKKSFHIRGFIWMYKKGDEILLKISEKEHRKRVIITDYSHYRNPLINAKRTANKDLVAMAEKIKVPIIQYDKSGNLIKEWSSATDAGNSLALKNFSSITSCCNGKRNSAYSFVWRYKEPNKWFEPIYIERKVDTYKISKKLKIPIAQFDLDMNFITKWDSAIDAGKELGIHPNSIRNSCNPDYRSKTAGGFIWKYNLNLSKKAA